MAGTISHRTESTGPAPSGGVNAEMMKMITKMIMRIKRMRKSLVVPLAFLAGFARQLFQRDSSSLWIKKYEGVQELEAWLEDYLQTIRAHGGTKDMVVPWRWRKVIGC
jgi:hypothetical protein